MHMLILDDEQMDLIQLGSAFYLGALEARRKRMDPEHLITRTLNVSRTKLQQVLDQTEQVLSLKWTELPETKKGEALTLMRLLIDEKDDEKRNPYFAALLAKIINQRPNNEAKQAKNIPRERAI